MKFFSSKKKKRRRKKKTNLTHAAATYTKRMTSFILYNAIVWVYLTYILAFSGKSAIAEQLSITIVKVIIYTFIPYLCKSLFENIFKYRWNAGDEADLPSPSSVTKEVAKTIAEEVDLTQSTSNSDDTVVTEADDSAVG